MKWVKTPAQLDLAQVKENHHVPVGGSQHEGVQGARGDTDRMKGCGGNNSIPSRVVCRSKRLVVNKRWREIDPRQEVEQALDAVHLKQVS